MKKLILTSAEMLLFSAVAAAQDADPSGVPSKDCKKGVTLIGAASSDATILLCDKVCEAWNVANPEVLLDSPGQLVQVAAQIESSGKVIFGTSVKLLDEATLTAKRDDYAFSR